MFVKYFLHTKYFSFGWSSASIHLICFAKFNSEIRKRLLVYVNLKQQTIDVVFFWFWMKK